MKNIENLNIVAALIVPWLFGCAFAIFVSFSLYYIHIGELRKSAITSGLFFLCVAFAYLPNIDTIKAFSVELKIQGKLNRAEEILDSVKKLTFVDAKSSLYGIANMGRTGNQYSQDKQNLVTGVLNQLDEAGFNLDKKRDAAQPWLDDLAGDLFILMNSILTQYVDTCSYFDAPKKQSLHNALVALKSEAGENFRDSPANLESLLSRSINSIPLDIATAEKIQKLKSDIIGVHNNIWNKMIYPDDLNAFMNRPLDLDKLQIYCH